MYGYIYETTNLINGKKYIGQKKSKIFLEEKYLGSGKILRQAIEKYGKENFSVKLLCKCNKQKTLDEKERYYINKYRKENIEIYNIAAGGNDFSNPFCTGEANHFYGKHHTKEAKEKISNAFKNRIWITKNKVNKFIKPEELDLYLQQGWIKGSYQSKSNHKKLSKLHKNLFKNNNELRYKCGNALRGKRWVHRGNERKVILPEELDLYIQQGWIKGTGINSYKYNPSRKKPNFKGKKNPFYGKHHTKETKEKIRQSMSSKEWKENHRNKVSEATKKALSNRKIREKMSNKAKKRFANEKERKAQSNRIKGFKWMTKDDITIQVKQNNIDLYLQQGYHLGRK